MDNHLFLKTLVERYLTNQATDQELEVFLELLKQGKLDEVLQTYLDQEADSHQSPNLEAAVVWLLNRWQRALQQIRSTCQLICQSINVNAFPHQFA